MTPRLVTARGEIEHTAASLFPLFSLLSEPTYNAVFTEFTTKLSKQLSRWGSLREILLSSHRDTGGVQSVTQLCALWTVFTPESTLC